MDNNVYILRCRRTGDAMLIDAANEHEELLDICKRLGVNQVVETHGHWDQHSGGARRARGRYLGGQ